MNSTETKTTLSNITAMELTKIDQRILDVIDKKFFEVIERHKYNPNVEYEDIFYELIGRITADSDARLVYGKDYALKTISWTMIENGCHIPHSKFADVVEWVRSIGLI